MVKNITRENVFKEARKGNLEVLKSPLVDGCYKFWSQVYPLHYFVKFNGNKDKLKEALKHPSIAKIFNCDGNTPLHYLGKRVFLDILGHPLVGKIKNSLDRTPLHYLALRIRRKGVEELVFHPDVAAVKDYEGRYAYKESFTPLHYLAKRDKLKISHLKSRYPFADIEEDSEVTYELIDKIACTRNSVKFIMGKD